MQGSIGRRAELLSLVLLTLGAFAVRAYHVGSVSLAEDEAAKWEAIQQYRLGHFAGVNSMHPMLMKVLAWGSVTLGDWWNPAAGAHGWPVATQEFWLRLPNLILGALIVPVLYLLGRQMMGAAGAGIAAFFWAFTPLPIALNRVLKEDTPLTFFTLLAMYCFWKAKRVEGRKWMFLWLDLSSAAFGLALASKYFPWFFGLNWAIWAIAGRSGLDHRRLATYLVRTLAVMGVFFVLANPVILSPTHLSNMWGEVRGAAVLHKGYNLDGHLYLETAPTWPAGMPSYFYVWLFGVKTPIPVLASVLMGAFLLLRNQRTMASIVFRVMVLISLLGLSMAGPKWMRYMLSWVPFVYLAGGYAVQAIVDWTRSRVRGAAAVPVFAALSAVFLLWPVANTLNWEPYFSLYLNALGGGRTNVARFFPHDEVYDLGTREAVQAVCREAPRGARFATSNPMTVRYYTHRFGRTDIHVEPFYDPRYLPRRGDFILVQDARRYYETQDLMDFLKRNDPVVERVRIGGVLTGTVYRFQPNRASVFQTVGVSTGAGR